MFKDSYGHYILENNEDAKFFSEISKRELTDEERKSFYKDISFSKAVSNYILLSVNESKRYIDFSHWIFPVESFILHDLLFSVVKSGKNVQEIVEGDLEFTVNKVLDFTRCRFEGSSEFECTVFRHGPLYDEACFKEKASFYKLEFQGLVGFKRTEFRKEVNFNEVQFGECVDFYHCKFLGISKFNFITITKGGALKILNSHFKDDVEFEKLTSAGGFLLFDRVHFEGEVSFSPGSSDDKTRGNIFFKRCTFSKGAFLKFENFKENNLKISFQDCQMQEKQVLFRECCMENVLFYNSVYGACFFQNCEWKKYEEDDFFCKKAIRGVLHPECLNPNEARSQKELYASLKVAALNSGDKQLAEDFHYWQLHFQQKETRNWVRKWYHRTSLYGHSILRPLAWWLGLLVFFWLVYWMVLFARIEFPADLEMSLDDYASIFRGLFAFGWDKALKVTLEGGSPLGFNLVNILDNDEFKDICSFRFALIYFVFFFQKAASLYLLFEFGQAMRKRVKL